MDHDRNKMHGYNAFNPDNLLTGFATKKYKR